MRGGRGQPTRVRVEGGFKRCWMKTGNEDVSSKMMAGIEFCVLMGFIYIGFFF